jgi:hypothetical protein
MDDLCLSEILVYPVVVNTAPVLVYYVFFVFKFHDSIEYTIKLRSMHQELLGALFLVPNF